MYPLTKNKKIPASLGYATMGIQDPIGSTTSINISPLDSSCENRLLKPCFPVSKRDL